jgi:hypothetical protein
MAVSFVALHVHVFRAARSRNFGPSEYMAVFPRLVSYLIRGSWISHKRPSSTRKSVAGTPRQSPDLLRRGGWAPKPTLAHNEYMRIEAYLRRASDPVTRNGTLFLLLEGLKGKDSITYVLVEPKSRTSKTMGLLCD